MLRLVVDNSRNYDMEELEEIEPELMEFCGLEEYFAEAPRDHIEIIRRHINVALRRGRAVNVDKLAKCIGAELEALYPLVSKWRRPREDSSAHCCYRGYADIEFIRSVIGVMIKGRRCGLPLCFIVRRRGTTFIVTPRIATREECLAHLKWIWANHRGEVAA